MLRMCLFVPVTRKSGEMSCALHRQEQFHLIVFTTSEQQLLHSSSCTNPHSNINDDSWYYYIIVFSEPSKINVEQSNGIIQAG